MEQLSLYSQVLSDQQERDQRMSAKPLSFRSPWGQSFRQPIITPTGILCDEWVYVPGWDGGDSVVKEASKTFSNVVKLDYDPDYGQTYKVPCSLMNLERFISLPYISPTQRAEAAKLLTMWGHMIPTACMMGNVFKATTIPDPNSTIHRQPRARRKEIVKRAPTPKDVLDILAGKKIDLTEEVIHNDPIPDMEVFQRFSNRPLFSQQKIGAWAILMAKRLGLFYDMRVGKTDTAIVAMRYAHEYNRDIDTVFVVAPKNNLYDPWAPNLQRLGFDVVILDGTDEEDTSALMEYNKNKPRSQRPIAFVLNYERIKTRWDAIVDNIDMERMGVIGDETSAIKNHRASRSKSMHALCERAEYVVLLNGTPMEQGPQDLWSQLRCIDPSGVITGAMYQEWVSEYLEEFQQGKFRIKRDVETRRAFEMMLFTCSLRYIRSEADQFGGKDKNFRYIKIKPTAQMAKQARNILNGFVETINSDGEKKYNSMSECILAVYGALRELSCGYDKYRESEDSEYMRVRHTVDPKLLWIKCFLESNPTEPLVVGLNFNEQEQALKEMLDEMGIKWSSTRPSARKIIKRRLQKLVPTTVWEWMVDRFGPERVNGGWVTSALHGGKPLYEVPLYLRYDDEIVAAVFDRFYHGSGWTEQYHIYKQDDYSAHERALHRQRFNEGETHVYICKVKEMRGFSLSRAEAVANNIGTYPTIVFTSPPWSLGDWDQAQDRCVAVDPKTNTNVCTMIYALVTPGMEDAIMSALRAKKEVAAELLKDAEREGYSSFVENLVKDMEEASASGDGDGFFDTDEMNARILCGVPPASKLTERNILGKMQEKYAREYGFKNRSDVLRWLQQERTPVVFSEDGVVLNKDSLIREAYFNLIERVERTEA